MCSRLILAASGGWGLTIADNGLQVGPGRGPSDPAVIDDLPANIVALSLTS